NQSAGVAVCPRIASRVSSVHTGSDERDAAPVEVVRVAPGADELDVAVHEGSGRAASVPRGAPWAGLGWARADAADPADAAGRSPAARGLLQAALAPEGHERDVP